jgi:hypothetical protein
MSPMQRESVLKRWGLTEQELTEIIEQNPSMRGLMFGYVAEYKLRRMHFSDPVFEGVHKADDHVQGTRIQDRMQVLADQQHLQDRNWIRGEVSM